ncbi:hypothetical protein HGRIS_002752 [Hohenbuehelia grisea]|uniref:Uncharacterized protein n=1 Tax=Hohenbuehelia grisea TaxID=104357 RepID=A0ABR3JM66_9AGAR
MCMLCTIHAVQWLSQKAGENKTALWLRKYPPCCQRRGRAASQFYSSLTLAHLRGRLHSPIPSRVAAIATRRRLLTLGIMFFSPVSCQTLEMYKGRPPPTSALHPDPPYTPSAVWCRRGGGDWRSPLGRRDTGPRDMGPQSEWNCWPTRIRQNTSAPRGRWEWRSGAMSPVGFWCLAVTGSSPLLRVRGYALRRNPTRHHNIPSTHRIPDQDKHAPAVLGSIMDTLTEGG